MNEKYTYSDLKRLQEQPLEHKIDYSIPLIRRVLKKHKQPTVAWSGGKDSTVLLHMILEQRPNIDVVWVDTGVEFPECRQFIRELVGNWNINLHIARPLTNFWDITEEYGWPMMGKGGDGGWKSRAAYLERAGKFKLAKATREAKISAACCRLLKHVPCEKVYRELNTDCLILGNMVSESRQRFLTWTVKGDYYYVKRESRYKVLPLAAWLDDDIWAYHKHYGIPHSKIYDKGHRRNGCWPCLMDFRFADSKLSILRRSHPKLWRFLLINKGLAERILTLKLALRNEESEAYKGQLSERAQHLIEERPCYFDSCLSR